MSATTADRETRPLATRPLRDLPPGGQRIGRTDDGTTDIYGHCAWFCNVMERFAQNGGTPVDEHGDGTIWCERHIHTTDARMADGTQTAFGLHLASPYQHGTYRREDVYGVGREQLVRLTVHDYADDEDERVEVYVRASDARSLAAALLHAADNIENLARPVESRRKE